MLKDKLKNKLEEYTFVEWVNPFYLDHGQTLPVLVTKFGMCLTAGVAAMATAFTYMNNREKAEFDEHLQNMDKNPTVIFTSKEDCLQKGYSKENCDCSYEQALNITKNSSLNLSYETQEECKKFHTNYTKKTTPVHTTHRVNGSTYTLNTLVTKYHPSVVAWQADKADICNAVPLYSSNTPDSAMRFDGKKLALKP